MKRQHFGVALAAAISVTAWTPSAQAQQKDAGPPMWAYGFATPAPPSADLPHRTPAVVRDNTKRYSVPGSKQSLTESEAQNRFSPGDWFPEDHPAMPEIVAKGRESAKLPIYACALCHMPNGKGRPENANVTGLPKEYFIQQMQDFRNGLRKTSDPRKTNTRLMAEFAQTMSDEDIRVTAEYFGAIAPTPWIKVVEAATVPKAKPIGGIFFVLEGAEAGTEPIGHRIVEVGVDQEQTEKWRNPRSGFIAYVPPGSLKKGEALVNTGDNGRVTACGACHGADLRGVGPIPGIAGRAASYLTRQIYDMQHGNRVGAWSGLMTPVVSRLDEDDVINVAAYAASLAP